MGTGASNREETLSRKVVRPDSCWLSGAPGDESHAGRGRSLRTPAAADLGRWPTSRPLSLSRSPAMPPRRAAIPRACGLLRVRTSVRVSHHCVERNSPTSYGSECVESSQTVIYSQLPPRSSDSPVHSLPITLAPLTFYRTTRLGFEGFTSIGFLELFGSGNACVTKICTPSETAPFSAAYSTQRERLQTWQ